METQALVDAALAKAGRQADLARSLGVSPVTVSRWVRGLSPGPAEYGALLLYCGLEKAEVYSRVGKRVMDKRKGEEG